MLDNDLIRRQLILKRQQLSPEKYQALSLLCWKHLQRWPMLIEANRIGLYCSFRQEVDTMPMIKALLEQNKVVLLPKIIGDGKMVFCEVRDLDHLKKGKFQILSPDEHCPVSSEMSLLIVPLTGYNQMGYRLGMGGGYYDRYLASHQVTTCGLAFSFQECSFQIYPHDQKLNYLINEKERLTFA